MATVSIRRAAEPHGDRVRKYRVELDQREVAALAWMETVRLQVAPGPHTLRMKIDWSGSPVVPFQALGDEEIRFVCRPAHTVASVFVALFESIRKRDRWLSLERE